MHFVFTRGRGHTLLYAAGQGTTSLKRLEQAFFLPTVSPPKKSVSVNQCYKMKDLLTVGHGGTPIPRPC